ncbi:MAG: hypothetical protein ABI026_08900 [Gemmatimonadaceae bacterium]
MRSLLLEIKNASEHRSLRLVQLAVGMRVHHKSAQLIRRMRRHFILYSLGHPDGMRHEIRNCVDSYDERGQQAADQSHDWYRIPSCQCRVLSRHRPRHHLTDYYMKQHSQREPRRAAGNAQADCYQRASNPSSRGWGRPAFLVVHRNAQGSLSGGKDRARQDERNNPDQPGRNPACPVFGW